VSYTKESINMINSNTLLREYHINLAEVVSCKRFTPSTRALAANLMDNQYHSVGVYFKTISDEDLDYLSNISAMSDARPEVEELIVLTLMLIQAEGTICTNENDFINCISSFKMMIAGTVIGRKGLIKVNYENLSFNDDMGDKIVFEAIEEDK